MSKKVRKVSVTPLGAPVAAGLVLGPPLDKLVEIARRKLGEFIPLDQCEHGWLYHIKARNFRLGIYNEVEKEFIGIRTKFGSRYLFGEYHWDTGEPFGTVKPITKLEQAPFEKLSERDDGDAGETIFDWLEVKDTEYPREKWPHEAPGHK